MDLCLWMCVLNEPFVHSGGEILHLHHSEIWAIIISSTWAPLVTREPICWTCGVKS